MLVGLVVGGKGSVCHTKGCHVMILMFAQPWRETGWRDEKFMENFDRREAYSFPVFLPRVPLTILVD